MTMKQIVLTATVLLGVTAVAGLGQPDQQRWVQADFANLHKQLTTAKEPWQSIPWHVSLLEARAQAVKENKPVYMLCRAGHPLGCV